jgi:hypothetical protein
LRVLVLALAVLGVLLAVFATAIDAWRFLRGVPRAFGVTFVLPGITCSCFTSRGRGVSFLGRGTGFPGLLWVALAFPHAPGVRSARVTPDNQ